MPNQELKEKSVEPQRIFGGEQDLVGTNPEERALYERRFGLYSYPIAIIGARNRPVYRNPSAYILDQEADVAITTALHLPLSAPNIELNMIDAVRTRTLMSCESQIQAGGDSYTAYIFPISGLDEDTYARVDLHRDSSILEKENAALREQLRHSRLMQAAVAHDLKTPLTIISGQAQFALRYLRDYPEDDTITRANQSLKTVVDTTQTMSGMITDLLDTLREARPQTVNISRLLTEIALWNAQLFKAKGLEFFCGLADENLSGSTDPVKYKLILNTIFLNASQAVDPGGIVAMTTEICDKSVIVYIEDNGIGMTEEVRSNCFKENPMILNPTKGNRLGLSTANQLAKELGGKIWIDWTEPGKGSRFAVSIPII